MAKRSYKLPASLIQDGAKLKNGNDMTPAMVGAYYGSSVELNVSIHIQKANGGNVECPADKALNEALRPKYAHGEFGAWKVDQNEVLPNSKKDVGRVLIEVATPEEINVVRKSLDRMMTLNQFTAGLKYVDKAGKWRTYQDLVNARELHRTANSEIQTRKDKFLVDAGMGPVLVDGKLKRPKYTEYVISELDKLNKDLWTATGFNLVFTFTGIHTIAKDEGFYKGRLNQQELDSLAEKLDYKENNSFWKGSLRRNEISVPIQTLQQLRDAISWLGKLNNIWVTEWSEAVRGTEVRLVKE